MTIETVEKELLAPSGLTDQDVERTLSLIAARDIDYADVTFKRAGTKP